MAKFSGKIGYAETVEIEPGVWKEQIVEHGPYYGDVLKDYNRFQSSGGVNDNINISHNISIVADPYANENFQYMKYVVYKGVKWRIQTFDIQYPKMILNLGGVYNEQQTQTTR